jgi:cell wall assembly regulator SMI1
MKEIWTKIDHWLELNCHEILEDLLAGVTIEEIINLEQELDIKLPDLFKQCYQIHNGQDGSASGLLGEWELFSLANIKNEWNVMKDLVDDGTFTNITSQPDFGIKSDWWNEKWIPIAGNGAGDLICMDLDPATGGNVGQIITFFHTEANRYKLADDLEIWLEEFANDLENGKYKVRKNGRLTKIGNK